MSSTKSCSFDATFLGVAAALDIGTSIRFAATRACDAPTSMIRFDGRPGRFCVCPRSSLRDAADGSRRLSEFSAQPCAVRTAADDARWSRAHGAALAVAWRVKAGLRRCTKSSRIS